MLEHREITVHHHPAPKAITRKESRPTRITDSRGGWEGDDASAQQRRIDETHIRSLAFGLLREMDSSTAITKTAEDYEAPSRHKLVTQEQAIAEFPEGAAYQIAQSMAWIGAKAISMGLTPRHSDEEMMTDGSQVYAGVM